MLDRTVAYNRAVANSTNQVLLLNVVRASQRLPTYYTRLEGDASSLGLTPNASLSLPLGNPRSFETDLNTGATGAHHRRHHQGRRRRWRGIVTGAWPVRRPNPI